MNRIINAVIIALLPLTLLGSLSVNNGGGASNITATSAWITATMVSTGSSAPYAATFWGLTNGTTNMGSWQYSNVYGIYTTLVSTSFQATGLSPSTLYYHRTYSTNATETNWAANSAMFMTLVRQTSAPASSTRDVAVNTNGVLKAPTNFFSTNVVLLSEAMSSAGFISNETSATLASNALRIAIGGVQTNLNNYSNQVAGTTNDLRVSLGGVQTNLNNYSNQVGGSTNWMITDLTNRIGIASNALALSVLSEASTRGTADTNLIAATNSLNSAIMTATNLSEIASNANALAVLSEAGTRGTADTNLNVTIGAVQTNVITASNALVVIVSAEAATRGTADTNLNSNVNTASNAASALVVAEGVLRGTADTNLQNHANNISNLVADIDISNWSTNPAVSQIVWMEPVYSETNLLLSGAGIDPVITNTYYQTNDVNGHARWFNTNGYFVWAVFVGPNYVYCISTNDGGAGTTPYSWTIDPQTNIPIGVYNPDPAGNCTGTITVAYTAPSTNYVAWKFGWNPNTLRMELSRSNTLVQTLYYGSNVLAGTIYGSFSIPFTNNLIAATGLFNSATGALNTAVTVLNNATSLLNSATGALNSAYSTATNLTGILTNTVAIINTNKLPLAGGAMEGNINMNGNDVTNALRVGFAGWGGTNAVMTFGKLNGTNGLCISNSVIGSNFWFLMP